MINHGLNLNRRFAGTQIYLDRSDTYKILGLSTVCTCDIPVDYSIPEIQGIKNYKWSYSGLGATIKHNNLNKISVTFSQNATSGDLSVKLIDDLGVEHPSDNFPISNG